MSGFEKQQQQHQQPQSPMHEQGQAPPAQEGVSRASTIMTAGGSSTTSSIRSGAKISSRRELYEHLVDTDHQLQLTLQQAEKAHQDLCNFDFSKHNSENAPGVMIWYRNHLDELSDMEMKKLEWDLRSAQIRLEQLVEMNVIRERSFLKPQPKKYTKKRMEIEVVQQQGKLAKIRETLEMAEAVFAKVFVKWLKE